MQTTINTRLTLRLPLLLKAKLLRAAKKNHRSLNSEILRRLNNSFHVSSTHAVAENKRPYRLTKMEPFTGSTAANEKMVITYYRQCDPNAQKAILKIIKAAHSLTS